MVALLAGEANKTFVNEGAWIAHLQRLGIAKLKVQPDPVKIATEGAIWGAIMGHGLVAGTVVLSDDAGQFNVGDHALCWVHAERLIHKLACFCERQRREKERIRTRIWWLYADLRAYKENPTRRRRG